jgi:hypothetical protein
MDIKWSPYVPVYPNDKAPYDVKVGKLRVVEPATRAAVQMNPIDDWEGRLERLIEFQRYSAVMQYDMYGRRIIKTSTGSIIDLIL